MVATNVVVKATTSKSILSQAESSKQEVVCILNGVNLPAKSVDENPALISPEPGPSKKRGRPKNVIVEQKQRGRPKKKLSSSTSDTLTPGGQNVSSVQTDSDTDSYSPVARKKRVSGVERNTETDNCDVSEGAAVANIDCTRSPLNPTTSADSTASRFVEMNSEKRRLSSSASVDVKDSVDNLPECGGDKRPCSAEALLVGVASGTQNALTNSGKASAASAHVVVRNRNQKLPKIDFGPARFNSVFENFATKSGLDGDASYPHLSEATKFTMTSRPVGHGANRITASNGSAVNSMKPSSLLKQGKNYFNSDGKNIDSSGVALKDVSFPMNSISTSGSNSPSISAGISKMGDSLSSEVASMVCTE